MLIRLKNVEITQQLITTFLHSEILCIVFIMTLCYSIIFTVSHTSYCIMLLFSGSSKPRYYDPLVYFKHKTRPYSLCKYRHTLKAVHFYRMQVIIRECKTDMFARNVSCKSVTYMGQREAAST